MFAVGFLLKCGKIVKQGRLLFDLFTLYACNLNRSGSFDLCRYFLGNGSGNEFIHRKGGKSHSIFRRMEFQPEIGLRLEILVFKVSAANNRQCRGLYPAERPDTISCGDRKCLTCVNADKPISGTTGFRRSIQVIVIASRTEGLETVFDCSVGK